MQFMLFLPTNEKPYSILSFVTMQDERYAKGNVKQVKLVTERNVCKHSSFTILCSALFLTSNHKKDVVNNVIDERVYLGNEKKRLYQGLFSTQ